MKKLALLVLVFVPMILSSCKPVKQPVGQPVIVYQTSYSANDSIESQIFSKDPITGATVKLTSDPKGAYLRAVSRDGQKILFELGSENGFWVINTNGTGLAKITEAKQFFASSVPYGHPSADWSWDGKKFALVEYGLMCLYKADGSGEKCLSLKAKDFLPYCENCERLFANGGENYGDYIPTPAFPSSLQWSPDGKTIAFSSEEGVVYLFNVGGKQVTLRIIEKFARSPSWSPDGKKIAFYGWANEENQSSPQNPFGSDTLFVVKSTDLSTIATFKVEPNLDRPEWSPDGKKIVTSLMAKDSAGEMTVYNAEIHVFDLTGSAQVVVSRRKMKESDIFPTWSFDGKKIAFVRYISESYPMIITNTQICLFDFPSKTVRVLEDYSDFAEIRGLEWSLK